MPPQVANFDEETKARPGIPNWNKTFAFVWRWFCSISYCFSPSQVSSSHCWNDWIEGCAFSRLRLRQGTVAILCLGTAQRSCCLINVFHIFIHFPDIFWCLMCFHVFFWCSLISYFSMSDLCLLTSTLMSHISHRLCLECRVPILMFFNDKMLVFMMCAGYSSQESTVHFGLNLKHLALKRIERE